MQSSSDGQQVRGDHRNFYFVDRSQDVLEVLNARMARPEDDAEIPGELPVKDHQTLRRDHSLLEFAISTVEDFKNAV